MKLKNIKVEEGTIKAQIIKDAQNSGFDELEAVVYIKNIAEHGCIGGTCRGLIYYVDTHAFYNKHAEEIDEILERVSEEMGELYNILENMKRLNQTDLRNFLAWFSYEVTAQEIM